MQGPEAGGKKAIKATKRARASEEEKPAPSTGKRSSSAEAKAPRAAPTGAPRPRGRPPKANKRAADAPPKKRRSQGKPSATQKWASSDESDHKGDAEVVSSDSDAPSDALPCDSRERRSVIESLEAALEGGGTGSLPARAKRAARPKLPPGYAEWTPGLSVRTVSEHASRVELTPAVPSEVRGLECAPPTPVRPAQKHWCSP